MNLEDILSGKAGLKGIHWALNGQSSRRLLRSEAQSMLLPGYRPGAFHLTRAKFKPDRHLLAYFTFPAVDDAGHENRPVQLAVAWRKHLDPGLHAEAGTRLQEKLLRLTPVQRELWRENIDQGLELQTWPFDPEFPQLARLGDPAYVAEMLPSLGFVRGSKRLPVITPIRYRPGERHVLRYELHSPATKGGSGQRIYAKLYSNGQDAARAFAVANRVADWLSLKNAGIQGNRPNEMSQEDGVVLYPHAPGIPLSHQLNRSPRWLGAQLRVIGGALAILHTAPETLQADLKQNTFTREARVVRRASEHVQVLLPAVHGRILKVVDEAERCYSSMPQEEPTFTHSDFKSDHLLTHAQGLTLIDFDTCTLTDPALDLGKFLADLEWWFTLKGISGIEQAQAELLAGYRASAGEASGLDERLARARLFHVLILVKIALRRVPIYRKDWAETTARIITRAAQKLDQKIAP